MGVNAGHHPMMRISGDEVTSVLEASGPPLGILSGADWQDESMTVEPGETLLLYTDGIAEARSGAAAASGTDELNEYGVAGLERVVRAVDDCSPRRLIEAVLADVDRYCSPRQPHDDCTMIGLRYYGRG